MEIKEKPVCQYGSKCYRKNQNHLEKYSHLVTKENSNSSNSQPPSKRQKLEGNVTLKKNNQSIKKPKGKNLSPKKRVKNESGRSVKSRKTPTKKPKEQSPKKKTVEESKSTDSETEEEKHNQSSDEDDKDDSGTVQSTSWVFISKSTSKSESSTDVSDISEKSKHEYIKKYFLVNMPEDFYCFFEFCKSLNKKNPRHALEICNLQLAGPFDVLIGDKDFSVDREKNLCHWRFYFDPPEFQTVLVTDTPYHIGYWRDDPNELPVFVVSNNPEKDCSIKIEAATLFGGVFNYLEDFIKKIDPFKRVKVRKIQCTLKYWANENDISLETNSARMMKRQKQCVSKTFHKAGIVVPVKANTAVGYRPLIESDANLKKICKLIMKATDESEREALFEKLQPLINAANIANDECDFGNSLELGIDLFCMGSPVFHDIVEHLLVTAYSLLNRQAFEEIIKAHLKNRRKGKDLSVC